MSAQARLERFCAMKGWICSIYGGSSGMASVHIYVGNNATLDSSAHTKEAAAERALIAIRALRKGHL